MIQTRIIIALGSNSPCADNITKAKKLVERTFKEVYFSRTMLTDPIGQLFRETKNGEPPRKFANCIATALTTLSADEVKEVLKDIEAQCGDSRENRANGLVLLDADLLLHGKERHHEGDWERPYIRELMKEFWVLRSAQNPKIKTAPAGATIQKKAK